MKTIREMAIYWNRFWFAERNMRSIAITRLLVATACLVLFLYYCWTSQVWYGTTGWFDTSAGLHFAGQGIQGTGAGFRWSILYYFPNVGPLVAVLGAAACLLAASGRFAPWSCLVAFISLAMFHHRAPLLTGVCEPLLAASMLYLCLAPSAPFESINTCKASVFGNIAIRLIQVHFAIWICFSLFTMLSNEGWWTGESVRRLLSDGQGLLPSSWAVPRVAEILAHAVILIQIGLLFAVASDWLRPIGYWFVFAFVVIMLLVISDWIYALALFATSTSIWPPPHFRESSA